MEKEHYVNLAAGLGIGVGAGICVGMLLAPKSMRQVIHNAVVDGEKYVEDCCAELRNRVNEIAKTLSPGIALRQP